ncbi:hypothetical protein OOK41_09215 [Micromonospora sp. NBC_01655]|uniref:hypothetical protein n=1 Tax=Micromonospora sp. NBC_01655 TaxID=2975983 RepID=UPI002256D936|nr:hypothetical protein [Micromonospora sp. NBC_01655]MCX4470485.1 hypothetical protein [Micromonospora sp. NBC_01655]
MSRPARDRGRMSPACPATFHGTDSAYRYGCRCPHAREHKRIHQKRCREGRSAARLADGTGTRRRLRALAALGWRWQDIGDRMGVTGSAVAILAASTGLVELATAARVQIIYRDLSTRLGPSRITADRATAKGWHGPMAWADIDDPTCEPDNASPDVPDVLVVDEWAVGEAIAGRLAADRLTDVDLAEAMRRLLADGLTPGQARYRLRLTNAHARRVIRAINTPTHERTRAA